MRISASCPPSRLYVKSGWPSPLLSSPGAFSTQSVCAWTLSRNAPRPKAAEASTMPVDLPGALVARGAAVDVGGPAVGRLVDAEHDLGRPVERHVPEPRRGGIRRRVTDRELLARAGILGQQETLSRRLDVVRLVHLGEGLHRVVVALDEHRQRLDLLRVLAVEHHLPHAAVRRPEVRVEGLGVGPAATRVDDVDDVLVAPPLVVGDVLDADELEDVVRCRSSTRAPTADRRCRAAWSSEDRSASCRSTAAPGSPCRQPSAPNRRPCDRSRCPSAP